MAKAWMDQNKDAIRQAGCAAVVSCSDMMPQVTACTATSDAAVAAGEFETEVMTQFGVNQNCKGATFARFGGLTQSSDEVNRLLNAPHWTLIIDFTLGVPEQAWSLQYKTGQFLKGSSATPAKLASDVCTIVMEHGGTLVR